MQRIQLKSKLHRAVVTDGNVNYVGSITIHQELIRAADLWEGEKVLVVDHTNGARLETYVLPGKRNGGQIIMNGGSARLITVGDRITIMAFGISEKVIKPKKILLDEQNGMVNKK